MSAATERPVCTTLCGTCRWWDHQKADELERKNEAEFQRRHGYPSGGIPPWHRISICRWGQNAIFPEWCDGLMGDRWTNEAGTTASGCKTWEPIASEAL